MRWVEHCTSIAEVMGLNPIGASEFVSGLSLLLVRIVMTVGSDHHVLVLEQF